MAVRPYQPQDFPHVVEIYAQAKLDEFEFESARFELLPLDQDHERLEHFHCSQVVVWDDGVVGAFAVWSDATVRALFVHPAARGKGVARQLMRYMLAQIDGEAALNVVRSNTAARSLYEQLGFRVTGEYEISYNGTTVIYNSMVRAPA